MLRLYGVLTYLLLPVALLAQFTKGFRNRDYWSRTSERFGKVPFSGSVDCWIHAVSVGEVRAVVPLVQRMLRDTPELAICVTTTTPTGSATVVQLLGDSVKHCYLPYDTPRGISKFLKRLQPRSGLIVETEIWPNLIETNHRLGIKLAYINVRLSERSQQRYQKFGRFFKPLLGKVSLFLIQSDADAERIKSIGAPEESSIVTGSIKVDAAIPASTSEAAQDIRRQIAGERPVWICGSTRDGEEPLLLNAFQQLREQHPDLLLLLVPRHPERFDAVARICRRKGFSVARRSQAGEEDAQADVYLADTMGELSLLYAVADIAYVGGSLVELGGQNILEPSALGIPVCFGPHMFNFAEISQWVKQAGAGRQVADKNELAQVVDQWLRDPNLRHDTGQKGVDLIARHSGALEKVYLLLGENGFTRELGSE